MAESLFIETHAPKGLKYEQLIPQVKALIGSERDPMAVLANTAAALHHTFAFLWTGFYVVRGNELVLGPFQGPVACLRIGHGKGVCGTAWATGETQVVPNVEQFPGHIACSSQSRSEIVVPVVSRGEVVAVLDIDSAYLNSFDDCDKAHLETLCNWIGEKCF